MLPADDLQSPVSGFDSRREMALFEYKGGKVTAKAFFGIGDEGYTKA